MWLYQLRAGIVIMNDHKRCLPFGIKFIELIEYDYYKFDCHF